jgi:hypothetical protein
MHATPASDVSLAAINRVAATGSRSRPATTCSTSTASWRTSGPTTRSIR